VCVLFVVVEVQVWSVLRELERRCGFSAGLVTNPYLVGRPVEIGVVRSPHGFVLGRPRPRRATGGHDTFETMSRPLCWLVSEAVVPKQGATTTQHIVRHSRA
jgi:hypothetical protein